MTQDALAAGFPPAGRAEWRAAAKAALGLSPDDDAGLAAALVRCTLDGLPRGPLMTTDDLGDRLPAYAGRAAAENAYPWDVRELIAHPDPDRAGAQARAALAGGATSLALRLAEPQGADCGDGKPDGVMVENAADLARALEGVDLAAVAISLDGPPDGPPYLAAWWADGDVPPERRRGDLGYDPLGRLARYGVAEPALEVAAATGPWLVDMAPHVSLFRSDARVVHEAGGSEAWELAFAAAAAAAYLEAMIRMGMSADAAAARITFALALDADVHLGIAKIRALRRVWRRITTAAGASGAAAAGRVEAFSSRRMLARRDPWTNLLRLTAAGFAAAAGGADSLALSAFTEPLGPPTDRAQRLSRNIGLVLAREAGLVRVQDPALGSHLHESLTDALARRAWAGFQEIAAEGGLESFIREGRLKRRVEEARAARAAWLERGEESLVGVSTWIARDLPQAEVETVDLAAVRARSSQLDWGHGWGKEKDDRPPYPPPLAAEARLRPIRLAEPFERLEATP
jgi:methylmalonyl-CoA mutase